MKKVVRIDVIRRRLARKGISFYSMFGVVFRDDLIQKGRRMHAKKISQAVAGHAWSVLKGGEQLAECWRI